MTLDEARQLKPDDTVRIIAQRPDNCHESPTWTSEMDAYAGQTGTVINVPEKWVMVRMADTRAFSYQPAWVEPLYQSPEEAFNRRRDENLRSIFT